MAAASTGICALRFVDYDSLLVPVLYRVVFEVVDNALRGNAHLRAGTAIFPGYGNGRVLNGRYLGPGCLGGECSGASVPVAVIR